MKKLSKIKLCDVKIMNDQEMKRILGGQSSDDSCKMVGGSGAGIIAGGTGSGEESKCSGACGAVWDNGTLKSRKCTPFSVEGLHGDTVYGCDCQ